MLPQAVSEVPRRLLAGDLAGAREAHFALLPLHAAMFVEPNPGPCKAAQSWLGKMRPDVRLPLLAASEATTKRVVAKLTELGVTP